jgi:hypothetical protein
MKIYIGPYLSYIGPYQIAEKILFWKDKDSDLVWNLGQWLNKTWLPKFCEWVYSKRKRSINVRIDKCDTWSMDNTLAHIVHPMLIQLRNTKYGAPYVDDIDVPDELKTLAAPPTHTEWDVDDNHFKRWDYVLDEMIFAFESKLTAWQDQYYTGEIDFVTVPVDKNGVELHRLEKGPNDTHVVDYEGLQKHEERIANGFRLFGKYYQSLWD